MERGKSLYHFGPFSLDAGELVLLREGRRVPLPAKALSTLLVLVRNSRHLVEKDVLMNEVWPDEAVEEGNLAQHIFTLRKALGETTQGRKYIETIPRRGYRFLEAVSENTDPDVPATVDPQSLPGSLRTDGMANQTSLSLAVLPFLTAGGNPNTQQLSDRITESIINSLSQVPRLRVMSRSAAFRYKGKELDPQRLGTELGVEAVLVGTVNASAGRLSISAELVDVANGWQLWGENFDLDAEATAAIQGAIAWQVTARLRSRLFGDEEQRVSQRFTEKGEAYQSYLEGRRSWNRHTRAGIQQSIVHFQRALELDPDYALAYAAIVDSYLRLATNYLLPVDGLPKAAAVFTVSDIEEALSNETRASLEIRYEWDLKELERELDRAGDQKSEYPAAHQWHAAYLFSRGLYQKASVQKNEQPLLDDTDSYGGAPDFDKRVLSRFHSARMTPAEDVQVFCLIAREQMMAGNYEAACAVLQRWWTFGDWPRLEGLSLTSSADLLLTAGSVAGCMAGARQVLRGQKHAEALLNGSIALFEQLGLRRRAGEGLIELAFSYFREGLFDLARTTALIALDSVSGERGLQSVACIMLGLIERYAGRLHESLDRLNKAAESTESFGPWATAFCHQELASTLRDLATAEQSDQYFHQAIWHQEKALFLIEAIGHHRCVAAGENNYGALLLALGRLDEAEACVVRARQMYDALSDKVRRAQTDDTLALLHLAAGRFDLAEKAVTQAVETLETSGQEPLFAKALRTQALVLCKLDRQREAKRVLDRACQVAERCDDTEGAGTALLIVIEEMCEQLDDDERLEIGRRLNRLLARSQGASTLERLGNCLELISQAEARSRTRGAMLS